MSDTTPGVPPAAMTDMASLGMLKPAAEVAPRHPYYPYLAGQPALVTGANSGIGKAVALGRAKAGADVIVNYMVDPEGADACGSRPTPRTTSPARRCSSTAG